MKKYFSQNKGQSLVEVTVALSILTIVLVGVVTLAVNAAGLMVASRMRTEATALAQEGLEMLKAVPQEKCDGLSNNPTLLSPSDIRYTRTATVGEPLAVVTGLPAADYALVTVTVSWNIKGQPGGDIILKQIMSKK